MTGEAHWFVLVAVMGGAVGFFFLVWFGAKSDFILRQRCSFTCPENKESVTCTTTTDVRTGDATDVKRCSAWPWPWSRCGKPCLKGLNDRTL